MLKIALAISIAVLLISNIFVGASNVSKNVNIYEEQKERIIEILNQITVNGEHLK